MMRFKDHAALLRNTLDSFTDMIQVFDAVRDEDGKLVDFLWVLNNKTSEKVYGDVIGKSLLTLNPGVVEEGIFETFKRVVETGVTDQSVRHYVHEQFNGWFIQTTIKQDDGVLTSTKDITDIKEAQYEIIRLKEAIAQKAINRYKALLVGINQPAAIFSLKMDAGLSPNSCQILEANEAYDAIFGTSLPAELSNDQAPAALEKVHRQILDHTAQVLTRGTPQQFECRVFDKWLDVHLSRIGIEPDHDFLMLCSDITERRSRENNLIFLHEVGNDLDHIVDINTSLNVLAEKIGAYYGLAYCFFVEVGKDWQVCHVNHAWQRDVSKTIKKVQRIASYFNPAFRATMDSGTPVVVSNVFDDPICIAENFEKIGVQSIMTIPLISNGVCHYWLGLCRDDIHPWRSDEQALAIELTGKILTRFEKVVREKAVLEREAEYLRQLEEDVQYRTAELQEGRDQLRSILNTTLIQMSILKAVRNTDNTIRDFRIEAVNHELEKATGKSDLVGKLYAEEYPGIRVTGLFDLIVKTIETGVPQSKEYFYPHDGFNKWFSCMFVKFGDGVVSTNMDISSRKDAEEKVKRLEAERQREIFEVSLSTLEEERHRISESLHNGIGQLLYGVKLGLESLEQSAPLDEFSASKRYTSKLLHNAIVETRRISHELMPITLEEFGLKSAIRDIGSQLSSAVAFSCSFRQSGSRLEKYLELAVYRTVQELMTNVVKHAEATKSEVIVEIMEQYIYVEVKDDGKGMDLAEAAKPGIGLASIRSKIRLLNGSLNINTSVQGTSIVVKIPLPNADLLV